jgi:outer membrane protein assembly factor BamB
VVAAAKELVALDLTDGHRLWAEPLPAPAVDWGLAVDREGRVIVTLEDGQVVCFAEK